MKITVKVNVILEPTILSVQHKMKHLFLHFINNMWLIGNITL